ncbi:MAG TPA: hypothetical protein VK013_00690 [Myxococcaceae bacterium]|nr:hypothetical protein [Myxococcaceae bacterium]
MGTLSFGRFAPLMVLALALAGCPKAPTSTAEIPPRGEIRIPEGCDATFEGEWVHARDSSYRYLGEDDGMTLVLQAQRVAAPSTDEASVSGATTSDAEEDDGGDESSLEEELTQAEPAHSELAPVLTLTRGPQGFTGATVAQQFLPNGTACEVPFPTTITACSDGSLTLSTATYVAVDAECTPAPTQGESPREEHRLVRPGAQRRGQDR